MPMASAIAQPFANPASFTSAFVVASKRRIVAERNGSGANQYMPFESRSMGKSLVGTLVRILVQQSVLKCAPTSRAALFCAFCVA